ncbi:L-threonine 3-dehydrogenase [uncultured Oceanicoccus sp.]|uniref:L-threonine 3-dehydrogenase n=1 Tax=uncultured Oceanicoccus sp. TaxID=1706381 RepID=UPI0030DAAC79
MPKPKIGVNDVLIKVKRTAICDTDLGVYNWEGWARQTTPVPLVVGHEFVGEVVEIGDNVNEYYLGQLVSSERPMVYGHCCNNFTTEDGHLCAEGCDCVGAFAEYMSLPAAAVWQHHKDVDLDVAALFDPLGNAVQAVLQYDVLGMNVLISGAGSIGAMAAAVCRHAGARHVVVADINPQRLELAKKLGATYAVNATQEDLTNVRHKLGMGEGFDVGLEMPGESSTFKDLLANMCYGGKVSIQGSPNELLAIDWGNVIFNMLTLKGIYNRGMSGIWQKMSLMIDSGLDIGSLITHRLDYTDFQQGFDALNEGVASKVILNWE